MRTEKELGEALRNNQSPIEVEGELALKVLKIKGTEKLAWDICNACIGIAFSLSVVTLGTAGIAIPVTGPAVALTLGAAATTLGTQTAITATGIAVAGGGVDVLENLRSYVVEEISEDKIVLYKM